jgi:arylsulfatase A-like enzyme
MCQNFWHFFNDKNFRQMKKQVLLVLFGALLVFNLYSKQLKGKKHPNIVFLLCDDLRWDALGFMGNKHILTPHIDRLAGESVVFTNAYHVCPISMPSRASIMTGQYLGMHGSGFNRPSNYVITQDEFNRSYPVRLRQNGYYTGFVGKFGFAVSNGSEKVVNNDHERQQAYMPKEHFDEWYGFPGQGQYRPQRDGSFNGYENKWNAVHLNEFMGYQAKAFIQKASNKDEPFCLSLSFKAPHAPFDPEEHFRSLYDDRNIPRMINDAPEYFEKLPEVVQSKSRNAKWYFGDNRPAWHIELDNTYQAFIKNYYGLITGLDQVVGRIRQKLNELNIANNTVIIFTSDNGFFCGSKQLMGKALLYEESARAPMVVYDPRYMKEKNTRFENGLISLVDIAPTILDLAGLKKSENMPGKSFMPVVYNEKEEIHEAVYGENNFDAGHPVISEVENPDNYQSIRSKFVRTEHYKYIRYHECHPVVEELWKISEDTLEANNLINDPEYEEVANDMRNRLDAFEKQHVDYKNTLKE